MPTTPLESFSNHLLHLSLLQLVTTRTPFSHSHTLPLHTLTHLTSAYLQLLATSAKEHAERAGRTDVSLWDLGEVIEEIGGGVEGLREEVESGGLGVGMGEMEDEEAGEERKRIEELARVMGELMDPYRTSHPPIASLSYISLTEGELEALALLNANAAVAAINEEDQEAEGSASGSEGGSTEDDEVLRSPSPSSLAMDYKNSNDPAALFNIIKSEETDHLQSLDDSLLTPLSAWRHPTLIPSHIPSFLPPFPGMGHEDLVETARHKREREREEIERERNDARSGRDGVTGRYLTGAGGAGGDPWITLLNIGSSTLREVPRNAYASTSLSPPPSPSTLDSTLHSPPPRPLRRKRSLSPSAGSSSRTSSSSSSLESYSTSLPQIPHAPTWARPNPLRRQAAVSISLSSEMSVSLDSLFASLPIAPTRSAGVTSGFLPDNAGMGSIHPFNTSLPHTISTPAVRNPAPHAGLLAPNPHPRLPSILSSIATPLSLPTSSHLTLFSRLTRIGPPGPLGPKGEALSYEFLGGGGVVASNVEWATRAHNVKLARGVREEEGKGGIKLSLNRGAGGRGGSVGGTPIPEERGESVTMQLGEVEERVEERIDGERGGVEDALGSTEGRERSQTLELSQSQLQESHEESNPSSISNSILPPTTIVPLSSSTLLFPSSNPIDNSLQMDLETNHIPEDISNLFSSPSYSEHPASIVDPVPQAFFPQAEEETDSMRPGEQQLGLNDLIQDTYEMGGLAES